MMLANLFIAMDTVEGNEEAMMALEDVNEELITAAGVCL